MSNEIERMIRGVALVALTAIPGAAMAQDSFVQLTFGHLDVDSGYADRDFTNLAATFAQPNGIALHFDAAYQSREEDAAYVAVGISAPVGAGGTIKGMIGTSDSNLGVYPELYLEGSYEFKPGAASGLIYRTGVAYSDYDGGVESVRLSGEIVKYFPARSDGSYFVGQLGGSVTFSDPGNDTGWEVSAATTYVAPSGLSLGVEASTGNISYDLVPLTAVDNDFVALRPFVGYRLSGGTELILRGEFVDSDLYDIEGASVGIKFGF